MSKGNFLNNFDKDHYDKNNFGKNFPETEKDEPEKSGYEKRNIEESRIVKRTSGDLPRTRSPRKHGGIEEVDKSYLKKKILKYAVAAGSVLLVALIAFFTFRYMNQVSVQNFVNKPVNEAQTWALKNNINIETESVFSIKQDENIVTEQNVSADSKIQKGSTLKLKVSKGPNPDELIKVPDFSKMNRQLIENWISENKAINVKLVQNYDDSHPSGTFIGMEYKEKDLTADTYRRKDILTVTVSKGKEVFEKNITVPDFVNKSKQEVESWAKTNKIEVSYGEAGSDKVPDGMIVSQSISANEKVAKEDKMAVTVSKGKPGIVPWFGNANAETAADLGAKSNLQVLVKTMYSDVVAYGELISQSVEKGAYLYGEDNKKVEVVYSEGRPYISIVGQKENNIESYFFDLKSKGANISYGVVYVDSEQPKGTIVWASKDNQYVGLVDSVEIHVANGVGANPSLNTAPPESSSGS
ncbi:hypothetical protein OfM1_13930 [Lactovum odontotermitis]